MPVGTSSVANYANTTAGTAVGVYAPTSVGAAGTVNLFNGALPTDGSPSLILDFVSNSDYSLNLDFVSNAYRTTQTNAGSPSSVVGSYYIWE